MGRETFERSVLVVPYGEALIHPYYWEGMAELGSQTGMRAVGAQSNLSFPVEKMLAVYEKAGGRKERLRLWGTFHPQMTTVEEFLCQCQRLQEAEVSFCVGTVGVPENLGYIDGYFDLELQVFPPDASYCNDSVLVQGDGSIRPCVRSHAKMGNLYTDGFGRLMTKTCTAGACDCYLSYNNRTDVEALMHFQPEPAFRIPEAYEC